MNAQKVSLPEYHITLFTYMWPLMKKNFKTNRDRPADILVKRYIDKYMTNKSRNFEEDIDAIREIQLMIEGKMKQIISSKGIFYWFHLYRRIAPKPSFGEDALTLNLYRNILECAFLKYGKKNCGEEIVYSKQGHLINSTEIASGIYCKALKYFGANKVLLEAKNDGIFLGKFNVNNSLEIYQLERLAFEYWHSTVCYRRLNKGGRLIIDSSGYYVENESTIDQLISVYDKRGTKFDDFSSSSGVPLNHKVLDMKKGTTLIPQYNVTGINCKDYPYDKIFLGNFQRETKSDIVYNFIWTPFNFDDYYIFNQFYDKEFIKTYGYRIETFVQTLYALLQREILYCNVVENPVGLELLKRAYRRFNSVDELAEDIVDISKVDRLPSLSECEFEKDEVTLVLKDLSYSDHYRNKLSLNTLGPRCLIFPSVGNGIEVDYASVIYILRTMMHFLKPIKEKKGHLFEKIVIERLETAGLQTWICQMKLIGEDETSKEIDASFIIGNVLFIAELKSNIQPITYIEGSREVLEHRKSKNIKGIIDADDKVNWLLTHEKGKNFELPSIVEYIVPIMVGPFREYIWTNDENFWIDENTPRICTISECCNLPNLISIEEFIKKPYVKRIK